MLKSLLLVFITFVFVSSSFSQTFTSSNLPIIILDTDGQEIRDDPKIMVNMGIIDNGQGVRNSRTDAFNNYDGKIGIEIRGSSSQMFPKKQYGVELWDDAGDGIDASLLGLPEEEDWVLFAPYNDKSLMRDVLAYKMGRDMGRYAPRTKYCEVVLNDQYNGVYVLIEKIKRDKNRVDINKLDPDEITGNNLTGGYILKIDKTTGDGGEGWASAYPPPNSAGQKVYFLYDTPEYDELAPEQITYIKQFMSEFENTLAGANFADPVNGYAKYIDVDSFIDFFLMNEVTKNVDGFRISTFLHKQRDSDGGKLVMGPIWDFNLGFGNADYCTGGNPQGFVYSGFNAICPGDSWLVPFWWKRLFEDEAFRDRVATRWTELRNGVFATDRILTYIDSVATVLNESQQRNFQRWPVLNTYVWPNYYVGATFAQEIDWLKDWIDLRLAWMDVAIAGTITAEEDEMINHRLRVFPNPFSSTLQFEYDLARPGDVQVELFDVVGNRIGLLDQGHQSAGNHILEASLSSMANGVYIYKYRYNNNTPVIGKVLKR